MSDPYPKIDLSLAPTASLPTVMDGEIYKNVGKYARSAVLYAFEANGGANALAQWAHQNQDEFYTKLFPKIIARESEVTHHRTVDQLMDVIDGDYEVEGDSPAVTGQPEVIDQIAHNWNAGDHQEFVDLMPAREFDGADIVDFEE